MTSIGATTFEGGPKKKSPRTRIPFQRLWKRRDNKKILLEDQGSVSSKRFALAEYDETSQTVELSFTNTEESLESVKSEHEESSNFPDFHDRVALPFAPLGFPEVLRPKFERRLQGQQLTMPSERRLFTEEKVNTSQKGAYFDDALKTNQGTEIILSPDNGGTKNIRRILEKTEPVGDEIVISFEPFAVDDCEPSLFNDPALFNFPVSSTVQPKAPIPIQHVGKLEPKPREPVSWITHEATAVDSRPPKEIHIPALSEREKVVQPGSSDKVYAPALGEGSHFENRAEPKNEFDGLGLIREMIFLSLPDDTVPKPGFVAPRNLLKHIGTSKSDSALYWRPSQISAAIAAIRKEDNGSSSMSSKDVVEGNIGEDKSNQQGKAHLAAAAKNLLHSIPAEIQDNELLLGKKDINLWSEELWAEESPATEISRKSSIKPFKVRTQATGDNQSGSDDDDDDDDSLTGFLEHEDHIFESQPVKKEIVTEYSTGQRLYSLTQSSDVSSEERGSAKLTLRSRSTKSSKSHTEEHSGNVSDDCMSSVSIESPSFETNYEHSFETNYEPGFTCNAFFGGRYNNEYAREVENEVLQGLQDLTRKGSNTFKKLFPLSMVAKSSAL
jgi:hypothetical protein